ncbi:MAG: uracil-DNA glycosylase family protein [Bacteroidota bacterium]
MEQLLQEIRKCEVCLPFLEAGCRPIVTASPKSKLVLIGQAPGRVVHETGVPWDDASGKNLRAWLGIDSTIFYNPDQVALIPMGFCYPGTGKSGDLPPRKECAPLWHQRLLDEMPNVQLTILIGQYAQKQYLAKAKKKTLTETVQHYENYLPQFLPLPHPSPRNNIWQKKNPWFKEDLLPKLQSIVRNLLQE